jgi:hypothetical protein
MLSFIDPAIVLSILYVVIHFCDSMWSFGVESVQGFFTFVYMNVVEDPIIKRGGLGSH